MSGPDDSSLESVASLFASTSKDTRDAFLQLLLSEQVWRGISPSSCVELQRLLPPLTTPMQIADMLSDNSPFGLQLPELSRVLCSNFLPHDPATKTLQSARRSVRFQEKLNYELWIRKYYVKMLQRILIKRKALLRSRINLAEQDGCPSVKPIVGTDGKRSKRASSVVWKRALKRSKLMLNEIKYTVSDGNVSSDEDNNDSAEVDINFWKLQRSEVLRAGTTSHSAFRDLALNQEMGLASVDEMLKSYKNLISLQPDHPSLELSDNNLMDIARRAGMESYVQKLLPSVSRTAKEKEPTVSTTEATLTPILHTTVI